MSDDCPGCTLAAGAVGVIVVLWLLQFVLAGVVVGVIIAALVLAATIIVARLELSRNVVSDQKTRLTEAIDLAGSVGWEKEERVTRGKKLVCDWYLENADGERLPGFEEGRSIERFLLFERLFQMFGASLAIVLTVGFLDMISPSNKVGLLNIGAWVAIIVGLGSVGGIGAYLFIEQRAAIETLYLKYAVDHEGLGDALGRRLAEPGREAEITAASVLILELYAKAYGIGVERDYRNELGALLLQILREQVVEGEARIEALRHEVQEEIERVEEKLGFRETKADSGVGGETTDGFFKDCELVGLNMDCDERALKKARRTGAKKYHPDRDGGDLEMMQKWNAALDRITDVRVAQSWA